MSLILPVQSRIPLQSINQNRLPDEDESQQEKNLKFSNCNDQILKNKMKSKPLIQIQNKRNESKSYQMDHVNIQRLDEILGIEPSNVTLRPSKSFLEIYDGKIGKDLFGKKKENEEERNEKFFDLCSKLPSQLFNQTDFLMIPNNSPVISKRLFEDITILATNVKKKDKLQQEEDQEGIKQTKKKSKPRFQRFKKISKII